MLTYESLIENLERAAVLPGYTTSIAGVNYSAADMRQILPLLRAAPALLATVERLSGDDADALAVAAAARGEA